MARRNSAGTIGAAVIDAAVYAAVVASIVVVASTLVAFAAGGDWSTVKAVLFVVGTVLLGYAIALLWASSRNGNYGEERSGGERWARARSNSGSGTRGLSRLRPDSTGSLGRTKTRFQRFVDRVPPLYWIDVDPTRTLSQTTKIFLAGVAVMAVSFCMEAVFGV
ncbi:DUF7555 family protein (plasmid) [Haloferacaceae archaeon DSL9]